MWWNSLLNFISSSPLWYKLFLIYMLIGVPISFLYLEKKTWKEIEKLNETRAEGEKASVDYLYLHITCLFYPMVVIFNLLAQFINVLIKIIYGIVKFFITLFSILIGLIILPISLLFSKKKGEKKYEQSKDND